MYIIVYIYIYILCISVLQPQAVQGAGCGGSRRVDYHDHYYHHHYYDHYD